MNSPRQSAGCVFVKNGEGEGMRGAEEINLRNAFSGQRVTF